MRITWKFAAVAAAAALVVTATPAGAAPSPTPGNPAPSASRPAVAQPLPALADALGPELTSPVEALRRDLGLTPEQLLAQAGIGDGPRPDVPRCRPGRGTARE